MPSATYRRGISLPKDGHHHRALARPGVAFEVNDLLPGAQDQLPLAHRHGQRWTEQGGLQVRMAVAVVPGLLVAVLPAGGNEAVQRLRQVALQARLELDGAEGGGAADAEDVGHAGLDAGAGDDFGDLV